MLQRCVNSGSSSVFGAVRGRELLAVLSIVRKHSAVSHYWEDWDAQRGVHPHAVVGGRDIDGCTIYVGKAFHSGDWLPAKVIPGRNCALVSYAGEEHSVHAFQILCHHFPHKLHWVSSSNGNVPPHAVAGGRTNTGEVLYVGRAPYEGSVTVGKVHPSHGCLYIPFGYKEFAMKDYAVLTSD